MNFQTHIETQRDEEAPGIIESFIIKEKVYQAEIIALKEQIAYLQALLFGRKSEKEHCSQNEPSLFDMPEKEFPMAEAPAEDKLSDVRGHKRKTRGRKPIPEDIPRVEVTHDIPDDQKVCQCGCMKTCCGQEVSEQLDIIPAQMRVIRNIRLKYACKACEGVDDDGPTVSIARMPDQIIPKCIGTPGLIAFVLVAKFVDALPFYRQEKQFLRIGVQISRATMCNWARKVGESFDILLEMLKKEILSGPLINIDETPVQVLNEPNRSNQTISYMWIFKGGTPENPVILFEYHPSRSGDIPAAFLDGYEGVVQTDGYVGYSFLDAVKSIMHMACWAHVRRKFVAVLKAAGKPKDGKQPKPGLADQALEYIRKLYKIERDTREQGLTGEDLLHERQEKAGPVIAEFKEWLDEKIEQVPPKSLLGKAMHYALNQWPRLVVWLLSPFVTLDNNLVENAIRPFAIGRKNWLFSATPEGAAASAAIYTIIETAKANGLEPYWYLRYLLERLPEAMTEDDFKALLPQYVHPSQLDCPQRIS